MKLLYFIYTESVWNNLVFFNAKALGFPFLRNSIAYLARSCAWFVFLGKVIVENVLLIILDNIFAENNIYALFLRVYTLVFL